jgi:hypothetical protein
MFVNALKPEAEKILPRENIHKGKTRRYLLFFSEIFFHKRFLTQQVCHSNGTISKKSFNSSILQTESSSIFMLVNEMIEMKF